MIMMTMMTIIIIIKEIIKVDIDKNNSSNSRFNIEWKIMGIVNNKIIKIKYSTEEKKVIVIKIIINNNKLNNRYTKSKTVNNSNSKINKINKMIM